MLKVFRYVSGNYYTKTVAIELLEGCDNHQEIIKEFAPQMMFSQGSNWFREEVKIENFEVIKNSQIVLANGSRTYCKKGNEFKNLDFENYCKIENTKKTILFNEAHSK